MPVRSYPTQEELNTACALDLFLVGYAFFFQILCIAVQDVDVRGIYVDVAEEVLVHEGVVRLGVLAWNADVFVLRGRKPCS